MEVNVYWREEKAARSIVLHKGGGPAPGWPVRLHRLDTVREGKDVSGGPAVVQHGGSSQSKSWPLSTTPGAPERAEESLIYWEYAH